MKIIIFFWGGGYVLFILDILGISHYEEKIGPRATSLIPLTIRTDRYTSLH